MTPGTPLFIDLFWTGSGALLLCIGHGHKPYITRLSCGGPGLLPLFLHHPWHMSGIIVHEEEDFPKFLLCQEVLPYRHGRKPWSGLLWQTRPACGCPPEHVRLLKLGNRTYVLE